MQVVISANPRAHLEGGPEIVECLDITPCVDMILQLRALAKHVLGCSTEHFGDTARLMAHMIEQIDMALSPQYERLKGIRRMGDDGR